MKGTEGTEHWGGNEAHGWNNQPQSFIYTILNRRNSSINSTQTNSTLNHQSAILNQFNLSSRLSKRFSINLAQQIIFVNYLSRQLDATKKTLTMHSLPWAKQRPDGRRGTFSAGHEAMERFLWNMGKICRQGRTISVYHGSWKPHSLTNSDQQSRCVFLPTWY